jgi:hypothetical protein
LLEGLRIEDNWARRAQVQLQVQQYASIYEAVLHHLLFVHCADRQEVLDLLLIPTLKRYSVSAALTSKLEELNSELESVAAPLDRQVVAAVEAETRLSDTKVRFDSKARAARSIGIIDDELADELIEFYAARNISRPQAPL